MAHLDVVHLISKGLLRLATALVPALSAALPSTVVAQAYPSKQINYVVPFVPGGGTDVLARVVGKKLSDHWGVPVVVVNRPGAGGNIGTEQVARAAPDGYTLLMGINSHAINASLYSKLNYDPIKDFAPVSLVATIPNVIVVNAALPVNNVQQLIAMARARPGQLGFGTAGAGSASHLAGELFKSRVGIELVHAPYKGAGQVVTDLVAGHVSLSFIALAVVQPQMSTGRLRVIAVTSAARSSLVPDIPTVTESGIKELQGFDVSSWLGTFAPAGTPPTIVSKLSTEIASILKLADVKKSLNALGMDLVGSTPEELARFVKADWAVWDKVIKDRGIRLD